MNVPTPNPEDGCDNDLPGSPRAPWSETTPNYMGSPSRTLYKRSDTQEGRRYWVKTNPGASFTYDVNPRAVAHGAQNASAWVLYRASATMPYVSGTNCAYTFRQPDGFTGTMGAFSVTMSGVTNSIHSGSGPGGWAVYTGVRYDSTHFADGATVKFVTAITNTEGKTFKSEDWYIAYNKHSVRACSEFETHPSWGTPVAASIAGTLGGMNHAAVGSGTAYTKSDFLADCERATAVHFSLHGWPTYLSDLNPPPTEADKATASEIGAAVSKISWVPPVNIVFGSACSTCASSGTISGKAALSTPAPANRRATGTGAFGLSDGSGADRAFVGFDRVGFIRGLQKAGDAFWKVLKNGTTQNGMVLDANARTVADARQEAQDAYDDDNGPFTSTCTVVGDGAATLFGLYQRQQPQNWFELTQ